ncbi:MAG: maleylacetoacetate isomerase, partial [Gammaproteobacteria bacterium]|nr:maleylacetoacetate isomerase [Gammaproteobacteria bacterium]
VPAIEHDGHILIQSLAIINYLERIFPQPALLPDEPVARARVSALAQIVAADMHPLNNLRVLQYLSSDLKVSDEQKQAWYEHWVAEGFSAIEALLQDRETGKFCHGNSPTLADVCLIPQIYNARRFECDLEHYPRIRRVEANCLALEAFDATRPELQPDAD